MQVLILLIIVVVPLVWFYMNLKKSDQKKVLNDFVSYNIVENDNSLKTIVDDYEQREIKAKNELKSKLGSALPNDIIWSILQDLSTEAFVKKNYKLLINVEYQRGLLLQKEDKYKDAIAHYSYGLYLLLNFYPHKFNPINHIIDDTSNENKVIEMSQYKFFNKIKLCVKKGNISEKEIDNSSIHFISSAQLSEYKMESFLVDVVNCLINQREFNSKNFLQNYSEKININAKDYQDIKVNHLNSMN